ncbi:MAG: MazG family protein, partial [Holophagales bacterium]|nr:MazG family protein [Holophagales bacterium]
SEAHLCEELGDLWLQVAFHACLARERGAFDIHDIEAMVVEKLLRRHPHVFAPDSSADTEDGGLSVVRAENSEQVLANWQAVKSLEKAGRPEPGLLEEMPASLSSLDEAAEIGRRCARAGFDWPSLDGVMDKVREEIGELTAESDPERVEAEFGDVLFSLVQWARYKKIDPDSALRKQMRRFRQRFKYVEARAREAGGWERIDSEQMEAAWRRAKGDG